MSDLLQIILKAVIWGMIYLKVLIKESRFKVIIITFLSLTRIMKCFLNMEKRQRSQ